MSMGVELPQFLIFHDGESCRIPNVQELSLETLYSQVIRRAVRAYSGLSALESVNPFNVKVEWFYYSLSESPNLPSMEKMETLYDYDLTHVNCGRKANSTHLRLKKGLAYLMKKRFSRKVILLLTGKTDLITEIRALRELGYPVICLHEKGSLRDSIIPFLESPSHWAPFWEEIIVEATQSKLQILKIQSAPLKKMEKSFFDKFQKSDLQLQLQVIHPGLQIEEEENRINLQWEGRSSNPLKLDDKIKALRLFLETLNFIVIESFELPAALSSLDLNQDQDFLSLSSKMKVLPFFSSLQEEPIPVPFVQMDKMGRAQILCHSFPKEWTISTLSSFLEFRFKVAVEEIERVDENRVKIYLTQNTSGKADEMVRYLSFNPERVRISFFTTFSQMNNFPLNNSYQRVKVLFVRDNRDVVENISFLKEVLNSYLSVTEKVYLPKARHLYRWMKLAWERFRADLRLTSDISLDLHEDPVQSFISIHGISRNVKEVKKMIDYEIAGVKIENFDLFKQPAYIQSFYQIASKVRNELVQNQQSYLPIFISIFSSNLEQPAYSRVSITIIGSGKDAERISMMINYFREIAYHCAQKSKTYYQVGY